MSNTDRNFNVMEQRINSLKQTTGRVMIKEYMEYQGQVEKQKHEMSERIYQLVTIIKKQSIW